jgi:hypothetical protein
VPGCLEPQSSHRLHRPARDKAGGRILPCTRLSVIPPRKRGSRADAPSLALDPRFRGGINEEEAGEALPSLLRHRDTEDARRCGSTTLCLKRNRRLAEKYFSLVAPAKAGAHRLRPLEYGPRLSPGRQVGIGAGASAGSSEYPRSSAFICGFRILAGRGGGAGRGGCACGRARRSGGVGERLCPGSGSGRGRRRISRAAAG